MQVRSILLAIACISFVQVRGDAQLNDAIAKGLSLVQKYEKETLNIIELKKDDFAMLSRHLGIHTTEYYKNIDWEAFKTQWNLQKNRENLTLEATKLGKPKVVFEILEQIFDSAGQEVKRYKTSFQSGLLETEKFSLEKLQTKLRDKLAPLQDKYMGIFEDAAEKLRACEDIESVKVMIDALHKLIKSFYDSVSELNHEALGIRIDHERKVEKSCSVFSATILRVADHFISMMKKSLGILDK